MRSYALTTQLLLAALVSSQSAITISPDSVAQSQRDAWCRDQKSTCPILCQQSAGSGSTTANDCDTKTLSWHCVCKSNGLTPNMSEFSLTIPYYVCTESNNQCVKACGNNNQCQYDCRAKNPCGAQNPSPPNASATASKTGTATGSAATGSSTDDGFGNPTSGGQNAANTLLNIGQAYGVGIVAAGIFAGAQLIL